MRSKADREAGKELMSGWLDTAIRLVEPVSIIIGGCWIAFLYFTYQERSDAAALKEKELAIQQAQIVLKTQDQSNALDLQLKNLSLEQAKIAFDNTSGENWRRGYHILAHEMSNLNRQSESSSFLP